MFPAATTKTYKSKYKWDLMPSHDPDEICTVELAISAQPVNVVNDQAPSAQLLLCISLSSCCSLITPPYPERLHRQQ